MSAKVVGLVLFACQIVLSGCFVIGESSESVEDEILVIQPSNLPEGYVAFPDDKVAYKLHENGSTWTEARDKCVAEGGYLANADSVPKIQHINSLQSNEDSGKWIHVGIHYSNATGQWVRVDNGLPVTSIPWAPGNPDGTGLCAGISINEAALVDYECTWPDEYSVCEIHL